MRKLLQACDAVEKGIMISLIAMLLVAVLAGTVEVAAILVNKIIEPPFLRMDVNRLPEIFGGFLMILIGIELLHSVKMYVTREQSQLEVVFTVAMIAIARKVIILDLATVPSLSLLGLGVVIVALAGGYFVVKRFRGPARPLTDPGAKPLD